MIIWRRIFLVGLLLSMLAVTRVASAEGGTIIVNTTSDLEDFGGAKTMSDLPGPDGVVSLREAVTASNNTPGPNTIAFNIPTTDPGFGFSGFTGEFVIFVEGDPLIVRDSYTTIDGRTQTAFTGNAVPGGAVVHIRTTPPYMNMSGIYLYSDGNVVAGLVGFSLFRYGIDISGNSNVIVGNGIVQANSAGVHISGANNRIGGTAAADRNRILMSGTGVWIRGSGATGNLVQGNLIWSNNSNGVSIESGASGNTIGGALPAARNFIYSNGHMSSEFFPVGSDVDISADHNLVQGNYVGVDESGAAAGGSVWSGIELSGLANTIRDNVISGHIGYYSKLTARPAGIRITGGGNHVIQGNLIGTAPGGTQPMPNEYGIKTEVWLYSDVTHDTQIGGRGPGEANVIAYNIYDGVALSGNTTRVSGNSIFSNGELGINLAPDVYTQVYPNTVTPNDPGDSDTGPNNLQNFPVITSVTDGGSSTTVRGTLDTQTPQQISIEVFSNDAADASGFGEGQVFLGTTAPDAAGSWVAVLPGGLSGKYITATATDSAGSTSEFSRVVPVGGTVANRPPVASASASPASGIAPLAVSFSSNGSYDPDGGSLSYLWDFGDSTSSTLANPSHTYASTGTYNARLTVTDSAGAFDSVAVVITANAPAVLRSGNIGLTATLKKNIVTVHGSVSVVSASGAPVPGAVVSITWTLPNGRANTQTATTNTSGIASFSVKGSRGTYTLTVNNITKSGYLFDASNSILSRSITQ
jgi:PKD repeat protein